MHTYRDEKAGDRVVKDFYEVIAARLDHIGTHVLTRCVSYFLISEETVLRAAARMQVGEFD